MIDLQSNYPVLAEQEAAWPAMLREGVERFGAEALRLPVFGGSVANRKLAAGWLGVGLERTWICTSGHHGTMAALLAAGLAGKTIAVDALTYPWFVRQAQMLGMRVVPVELDGEGMVPESLRRVCAGEGVAAVYTMPSMHNPTGAIAGAERRGAIVDVAREFGLTIVEDAAYGFLVEEEPVRYTVLAPERAFYVESLSKRVVPGLRTCFLVAPEQLGEQTALALRVMTSGSSTLLASMGCAMAADGSLQQVIAAKRVEGERRRLEAMEILRGLDALSGKNSWHVWVTLTAGDIRTDEQIERACEERGVLVTGARWFTAPGAEVPRAVRAGLGGETDLARAEEGLRVFAEVVRGG
jgi:DNA-binding transcriptional MocR family regulator